MNSGKYATDGEEEKFGVGGGAGLRPEEGTGTMDYRKLKKPEHLKETIWRQHLRWLQVTGGQLDENFARHQGRVEEDAQRSASLWEMHRERLLAARRLRSLYTRRV